MSLTAPRNEVAPSEHGDQRTMTRQPDPSPDYTAGADAATAAIESLQGSIGGHGELHARLQALMLTRLGPDALRGFCAALQARLEIGREE